MATHAILPSQLAIELTESTMIGDNLAVQRELAALEAMGMRLMIDDFGTGYSSLARSLGIATVAEGVETVQQLQMLRLMGCDEFQGYLASPPVPTGQAEAWLNGAQFFEPLVLPPAATEPQASR